MPGPGGGTGHPDPLPAVAPALPGGGMGNKLPWAQGCLKQGLLPWEGPLAALCCPWWGYILGTTLGGASLFLLPIRAFLCQHMGKGRRGWGTGLVLWLLPYRSV